MAGYNYEQSTCNRLLVTRNGLIYPDAVDLSLALGQAITTGGGYEKWAILGGFSRLNYSYKDRYLIEVNARYDGSSKFPSNQRFAFFPSVSAGWRISKESFWNVSPKIISDLKAQGILRIISVTEMSVHIFTRSNSQLPSQANILKGQLPTVYQESGCTS